MCARVCAETERERERERERKRERERERERERTESFPRPAYPKIHLSVLQTACVRIFRFMTALFSFCLVWFFCRCTTYQSQQKCQRTMFSIIYLLRTVWELTFSIKQMHYKTGTLWHSDASILFTLQKSRMLVLLLKSFWIKDRRKFLQKQCTVCGAFDDADMSFLERLMSGQSLFPWSLAFFHLFLGSVQSLATVRFVYKPAMMANSCWASNAMSMFIGLPNFSDQSGLAVYFRHGNSLKYANVHER